MGNSLEVTKEKMTVDVELYKTPIELQEEVKYNRKLIADLTQCMIVSRTIAENNQGYIKQLLGHINVLILNFNEVAHELGLYQEHF